MCSRRRRACLISSSRPPPSSKRRPTTGRSCATARSRTIRLQPCLLERVVEFRPQGRITQRRPELVAGKRREALPNIFGLTLRLLLASDRGVGNRQHDVRVQVAGIAVDSPLQGANGVFAPVPQYVSHSKIETGGHGNVGLELRQKLPGGDRAGDVASPQQNRNEG